jgi:hypothetical protein
MALLLGFMRGYDILLTGDAAHRSFITYPVDRLANELYPDLADLHKQFSSMERPVFGTRFFHSQKPISRLKETGPMPLAAR